MTTVRDIVTDAASVGAVGQGESLSNTDAQLILRRLARLMDSWSNQTALCFNVYVDQLTLGSGVSSYLTSLLPNGRPVSVDSLYIVLAGTSFTVDMVSNQTYSGVSYKVGTGVPTLCYYNASMPDGTFNFYPVPYIAMIAYVSCRATLQPAAMTLDTVLSLPPGYERFLTDQLAVDICPSFGLQADPNLVQSAREAAYVLKRTNYQPLEMNVAHYERPNIITGP